MFENKSCFKDIISFIDCGQTWQLKLRNGYRNHASMVLSTLIVIGELMQCIYYSTQNGFIWCKRCTVSGSWIYNHRAGYKFISRIVHFYGFQHHTTAISTELGNVNVIEIQFLFIVIVIGIFVYLVKYQLGWILGDVLFIFQLARKHTNHVHWEKEKFV